MESSAGWTCRMQPAAFLRPIAEGVEAILQMVDAREDVAEGYYEVSFCETRALYVVADVKSPR